jgi:hypothetical protein
MSKTIDDPEVIHRFVRERLADYQRADYTKERAELVAQWKRHHPEAGTERSQAHRPLELSYRRGSGPNPENEPDEIWFNDVYNVTLRRHQQDRVFGTRGGMIQLGINTHDGTARHDWREFQWIKNQLAGEECEAFELYPAESRLLDPSNYYTLWCFPGLKRIKVGHEYRRVWDHDQALAPQRALPQGAVV